MARGRLRPGTRGGRERISDRGQAAQRAGQHGHPAGERGGAAAQDHRLRHGRRRPLLVPRHRRLQSPAQTAAARRRTGIPRLVARRVGAAGPIHRNNGRRPASSALERAQPGGRAACRQRLQDAAARGAEADDGVERRAVRSVPRGERAGDRLAAYRLAAQAVPPARQPDLPRGARPHAAGARHGRVARQVQGLLLLSAIQTRVRPPGAHPLAPCAHVRSPPGDRAGARDRGLPEPAPGSRRGRRDGRRRSVRPAGKPASPLGVPRQIYPARLPEPGVRPLRAVAARNGTDRATLPGAAGGGGHLSGSRAGVEAIRGRQRAERQPVERAAPRQYRTRGSLRGRRYPQLRVDRARREGSGDVVGGVILPPRWHPNGADRRRSGSCSRP